MSSFLNQIQQILEIDANLSTFDPNTKLVELGADSVKLAEISVLIEETYNRPILEDEMMNLSVGFLLTISQ